MPRFEWTKKHTTILIYTCITILLAIAIVLAILFPHVISNTLGNVFGAVSPAFFGFAIAYLFHPVSDFFENKVFAKFSNGKPASRGVRVISVACTFIVAALVISLFIGILVPQVVKSYLSLEDKFEEYLEKAVEWLSGAIAKLREKDEYGILSSLSNTESITDSISDAAGSMFNFVSNVADTVLKYSSKALSLVTKTVISIIFAIYFLIFKDRIFLWISKFSDAILPHSFNRGARYWISYSDKVFSRFITGKLVNATIITVVNFIVFGICGIPYYPIVALVTGITDLIPYFGPFIGAIPCAFIILIADPVKVIWFAVLVLVIQQVDGNIVGPKILGEKVGVDSLLIIVAITVGGGLFGIAGMFISVPVFTVLSHAVNSFFVMRLRKKGLPTDTAFYERSSKEAAK